MSEAFVLYVMLVITGVLAVAISWPRLMTWARRHYREEQAIRKKLDQIRGFYGESHVSLTQWQQLKQTEWGFYKQSLVGDRPKPQPQPQPQPRPQPQLTSSLNLPRQINRALQSD